MPIRWRLTLWFVLILFVILVISAAVLYELVQSHLREQVDDTLRVSSARVHGTLDPEEIPQPLDYDVVHSHLPPINEFAFPGVYVQLVDATGEVVVKSDTLGDQELPYSATLMRAGQAGRVAFEAVATEDAAGVRIMVSPLYLTDRTLLLQVAQSLTPMESALREMRVAMVVSILVALALTTALGVIIVRSALAPVGQITRTARSIEASPDLTQRVGYKGPQDVIGRLATTFDHMIEHLDAAFRSQKDFVTDASHELRGPITIIRGNIDLLKRALAQEDREECLEALDTETSRMVNVVNDLLLLADVESQQPDAGEQVNLRDVVHEEMRRAEALAEGRHLMIDREEDVFVAASAHRLQQLLGNLVNNAINYTAAGDSITLSLHRQGDRAYLEVADTGIGISADHLPHIFNRFYRVDKTRSRMGGGTGLGLAIVQKIATQHDADVVADSEPGRGSRFTVRFQLADGA
jgi:signal transduction histidine kinase